MTIDCLGPAPRCPQTRRGSDQVGNEQSLVPTRPRDWAPAVIYYNQLDRVTRSARRHHFGAQRIQRRERFRDSYVLALGSRLPPLVRPQGCTTRYFAIPLLRRSLRRSSRASHGGAELIEKRKEPCWRTHASDVEDTAHALCWRTTPWLSIRVSG
jgi:hypothetical protein